MGKPFDPYHKWLGIPPEEQPPNHYRLLGIKVFETDADVIEAASDQRMSHLRGYQTGRHADLSQRLLNEIAAARLCLLTPSKRASYDAQLRQSLQPVASPAVDVPAPPVFTAAAADWPSGSSGTYRQSLRMARKKQSNKFVPILTVICVMFALVGAIAVWQLSSSKPSAVSQHNQPSSTISKPTPPKPAPQPPKTQPMPPMSSPLPSTPLPTPRKATASQDRSKAGKAVLKLDLDKSPSTAEDIEQNPSDLQPKEVVKQSRLPMPPVSVVDEAVRKVRNTLKNDLANAKTSGARLALANKVFDQAGKQPNDHAATVAMYRLSRDLAVQAGDGAIAMRAVEAITGKYETDSLAMKADTLSELTRKSAHATVPHAFIAFQAASLMEEAAAAGNLPMADKLGKLAAAEGTKDNNKTMTVQVRNRLKEIQADMKLASDFEKAKAALADHPDDPDNNFTVASYHCFLQDNWAKGLPYMAKGNNEDLKALSKREIQTPPKDAADYVALADAWWDLAQKNSGTQKNKILMHAGDLYAKARPKVDDAAVSLKISQRLEEVANLRCKTFTSASPAIITP